MTINLFFELIQVAIGRQESLSHVPSVNDWRELYDFSVKQAVDGVCFYGVQQLPKEQKAGLPESLKMQWLSLAARIQQQNEMINRKCAEVYEAICKEEFGCVVLKGQGMARYYKLRDEPLEKNHFE